MKQIPLSTTHARLGAVFAEFSGWEIPRHYGDSAKEHSAVRGGAGLCDRSFLGKMRVCGKDRQEFLHSLVSNNVKSLRASEGTYATLLTPKGKMLGDLWIYVCEEDCLILTEACAAQTIAQTLEKYILMSDVSLENQTESHGVLSIFGPHSAHLVRTLLGELPAGAKKWKHVSRIFHGSPILIARNEYTGEEGFDLLAARDVLGNLWSTLRQEVSGMSALPIGWDTLEILRVEAGIPRFGQDMDKETIPLEAGIEASAIDFHKGCYIGQEIISRAAHRGHVNRKLIGLKLSPGCLPATGDTILREGTRAGEITTAVSSPRFGPIALGYIHRDLAATGENFLVGGLSAQTVDLPFYSRMAESPTSPRNAEPAP